MRWTILCTSCMQVLRMGPGRQGQPLRCPRCAALLPRSRGSVALPPAAPQRPGPAATPPAAGPRPFWGRRRLLASGGTCVLLALLVGVVGSTWASRQGRSGFFGGRMQEARGARMIARAMTRQGPAPPPAPRPEKSIDLTGSPVLGEADADPPPALPGLPLAGEIVPCCALAGDPGRGLLLAGSREGTLHCYDASSLRRLGSCPLAQPAYRLALDGARGLLYAASATPRALVLGRLGDRERASGDVHVYDLTEVLARPAERTAPLRPAHTLPIGSQVHGLILTPDGDHLYVLTELARKSVVERVDTRRWTRDGHVEVAPGGPSMLSLSPGGLLYALSGGRLYALDPHSWTLVREMRVGATVVSFLAGREDRLYVLERRERLFLHLYDLRAGEAQGRLALWSAEAAGRTYLRMAPDGSRIYVSNSAVTRGCVKELDVSASDGLPRLVRDASSDPHRLLRGPLLLGPGARYAVTGSGQVLRLASS
jgi:hypothetical protein